MAVVVQVDSPGVTLNDYDEFVETMGLLPGGPPPRGVLFHCVTETADGIRTIDVWESREAYSTFFEEKVVPLYREMGTLDSLNTQFSDVHNYFVKRP